MSDEVAENPVIGLLNERERDEPCVEGGVKVVVTGSKLMRRDVKTFEVDYRQWSNDVQNVQYPTDDIVWV